jgi:AraC-like DNA-binding protein
MDHREVANGAFTRVTSSAGAVRRPPELIGDASSGLVLFSMQLRGRSQVTQGDGTATVLPSHGVLYRTDAPYDLMFATSADLMIVQLPIAALSISRDELETVTAVAVRLADDAQFSLLARVVGSHLSNRPLVSAAAVASVSAELLGSGLHRLATAASRPMSREALSAVLRSTIVRRLDDPRLSVSSLAQEVGASTRAVHAVFADEGTSPSREIRHLRLARAAKLLASTNLPIAEVARASGFADAATFRNAFRREAGQAPRDYRASMRTGEPYHAARS